jgi:hypothetical protein
MAEIELVGSVLAGSTNNGGDVTLTLPAEITAGDTVVVFGGHPHRAGAPLGPSTSGYTQAFTPFNTQTPNFGAWYKVMGSSPDANVVLQGTANVNDGVAYGGWVLRGTDTSTVLDAAPTTAGPTSSTNPDAPSITTVTPGAWVLSIACSNANDGNSGTPNNYENVTSAAGVDGVNTSIGGATIIKATPGAEDPPAFPSWGSGVWYAATLAIRPASDGYSQGGTGVLTDAAGPETGSGDARSQGGTGVLTDAAN